MSNEKNEPSKKLPVHITERLKALILELEKSESKDEHLVRSGTGTIELKISENEALWFVAYKTSAQ